ncbi:Alpha/Beta hydrolase protein [Cercophora scortea]|uniref:Alpha/Beta hydrolase protein n=1 Tax=Cercophora scortea TaxID=314031 RepID=A0AAE0I2L3_9PEZI|nr:Alpha/Beta hydrolase protein [Cercophora scortea]
MTLMNAARAPQLLSNLVLVHGLNGDRIQTWTHDRTGVCWPRDLLPAKLPLTRVLSFGFNADIYGNTSVEGIRGNARALLSRLIDERDDVDSYDRPIVFVAHSLGGLIVKQALRFAHNETTYQSLATSTRGLLFYGTPHAGSSTDRWLQLARSFAPLHPPKSKSHILSPFHRLPSPLVQALESNSTDIADICEDFRHLARRYAIISFYETHAWPGTRAPIVDRMSALMMLDHEDQVPLEAHHLDLCRFADARDEGFRMTCRRIEMAAKGFVDAAGPLEEGGSAGGNIYYEVPSRSRAMSEERQGVRPITTDPRRLLMPPPPPQSQYAWVDSTASSRRRV